MKIVEKIVEKSKSLHGEKTPVIAFLGDSVTQGCFEVYLKNNGEIETVFDAEGAYHAYLQKILATLFPNVPVTMINAGISGDSAEGGLARLARDILPYAPDLTVVSYGLNDASQGIEKLPMYKKALGEIFRILKESGSEVIFLTENMMNTEISCHIKEEAIRSLAGKLMEIQTTGVLDTFFSEAKKTAEEYGVKVCDVYSLWKKMEKAGVDITSLLSNYLNHPVREMNKLTAFMLVETLFQ